jgi:hypothetical protein
MCVEDGAALGALLSNLPSKEEVTRRLHLFQDLRLDRVSAIETLSSVGQDEIHKIIDKARSYVKGPMPSKFSGFPSRPFWFVRGCMKIVGVANRLHSYYRCSERVQFHA